LAKKALSNEKGVRKMLMKLTAGHIHRGGVGGHGRQQYHPTGVNFTNVLPAAFTLVDPGET